MGRDAGWQRLLQVQQIVLVGRTVALDQDRVTMLGAITPIGGIGMLCGWLALVLARGNGRE